jgi:putative DNA primase/helicase
MGVSQLATCGKLVFIDDDVPAGIKLPDGTLKKVSEAKIQTGQHKYKDPFNFINLAFPIILCNNTPSLSDLSYGMMRRLLVLPFDRIFGEGEKDAQLFNRTIDRELPGVLNRALQGWQRLKRRKRFPTSMDMDLARQELLAHANPLKGFLEECCENDPKSKVSVEGFYSAYCSWADESGYSLKQVKSTVKKNLQNMGYDVVRHGVGLVIIGLKLR